MSLAVIRHRLLTFRLPLILTLCMAALMLFAQPASRWMRYDRLAILQGQLWRLCSGHLVHLGWSHLAMNVAGLWLVWLLVGKTLPTRDWLLILIGTSLGVSLGLLVWRPGILWYVGLSGVLHGLFVSGSLMELRRGHKEALLFLALLITKLCWEQLAGPLPGSEATAGGHVVVAAHLYGALSGALLIFPYLLRQPAQR